MAHSDWVNSSSRVIKAKAVARAYDSFSASFEIGMQGESLTTDNDGNCHITVEVGIGDSSNNVPKYLQITGNKERNEYPVDFTITNERYYENTGEDLFEKNITNNNATDCIIYFKEYIVPSQFDIVITKWSKPNITLQEDSITYAGPNINFDLIECGMLSNFETDISLPYDGTNDLQYGFKTSSNSIELSKDVPNTGNAINNQIINLTNLLNLFGYVTYGQQGIIVESNSGIDEDGFCIAEFSQKFSQRQTSYDNKYYVSFNVDPIYNYYGQTAIATDMRVKLIAIHKPIIGNIDIDTTLIEERKMSKEYPNHLDYQKSSTIIDNIFSVTNMYGIKIQVSNYYRSGVQDIEVAFRAKDILMLDLTSLYGQGNEPSKEWCDENVVYSSNSNTLTIEGNTYIIKKIPDNSVAVITRSEILTRLENKPYIEFSMSLDKEFDYTKIGNYFIDSFDYEENNPKFRLQLKDNTKLLEETNLSGVNVDNINNETYKSVNKLFNNYINTALIEDTGLEFGEWGDNDDIELQTATYSQNYPYAITYNKCCQAIGMYLIQDITDIHRLNLVHTGRIGYNLYSITNNKCVSLQKYNKLDNSIKNASVEVQEFEQSNTGTNVYSSSVESSRLEGYISDKGDVSENMTVSNTVSTTYPMLITKLNNNGNTKTGTITIPLSTYNQYKKYSIELYGVRAKYIFGLTPTLAIYQDGVPSGTNDSVKNYITSDGSITTDITALTNDDFQKINWANCSFTITQSGSDVVISYTIKFNRINDTYQNTEFMSIMSGKIQEEFLGAYKVVLMGYDFDSRSATFTYSNGKGNTYSLQSNEFVQLNCKYIKSGTLYASSPSVQDKIADKILTEFGDGKSVAKLEWVGSPYIKIFDIVTLDNGITYRVHYIRHKYDGGYRQVLYLVEKE